MVQMKRFLLVSAILLAFAAKAGAQAFAIKTNLLEDAALLAPNLGLEFGLGRHFTFDMRGGINNWNKSASTSDGMNHWVASGELRWWMCERFNGNFFGLNGIYADYDVNGWSIPLLFDKDHRFDGTAYGAGISWGYHWMWSRRWGLEFNLGAGYALLTYDKYDRTTGVNLGRFKKDYLGPTRAGVTLVFLLK